MNPCTKNRCINAVLILLMASVVAVMVLLFRSVMEVSNQHMLLMQGQCDMQKELHLKLSDFCNSNSHAE